MRVTISPAVIGLTSLPRLSSLSEDAAPRGTTALPGQLHLDETGGEFAVTLRGERVLVTRNAKRAISKFNKIRRQLETRFPAAEPTPAEATALLRKHIGECLVDDNHFRPQQEKKAKKATRTFG